MSSDLINFIYLEARDLGELCQPSKVNRLIPHPRGQVLSSAHLSVTARWTWVSLATGSFCNVSVYLLCQEGARVTVLCRTLIKIREAIATKQSFQKPFLGFPGCRAACIDTQTHPCGNYYCHPIIVIVMSIQLPLCTFLEGRDRVVGCFSWIHAFLLPFTRPTNIYWVQPLLGLPQCRGHKTYHLPVLGSMTQPGCQPSSFLGNRAPQKAQAAASVAARRP